MLGLHSCELQFSVTVHKVVGKGHMFVVRNNKINDILDKPRKPNGSKSHATKQNFHSCFSKNKGFKIMCNIPCIFEAVDLGESADLTDVSDIELHKYEGPHHATWNGHFVNTKQFRDNRHGLAMQGDTLGLTQQWLSSSLRY